jgi:putative flippase GtrA
VEARCTGFGQANLLDLAMKLIGFFFAGGLATLLNYLVFLLVLNAGVHFTLSSAIGYASGITISFWINKLFVFKDAAKASLGRYFFAYGIALIAQLGLLNLLVFIKISPEIANAIAIAVVVFLNFFVVRRFVFSTQN